MNISSRHHYLPVFYLKGFTDADGKFFVFNKEINAVDVRERSPKSVFFEKDRNTVMTGDESNDFLEQIYSKLDSDLAPAFKRFQEKKNKEISAMDIVEAHFFASSSLFFAA